MTKTLGVIPARMSSSRFPGKPLENILDIPMIAHCYERAAISEACDYLVIATPDDEIMEWASSFNIPAILTSDAHERATERAAEVLSILESDGQFFEYVLLLQGDEPQINPLDINKLNNAFHDFNSEVVNLVYPIDEEDMADENVVKAILTTSLSIKYFTRAHVPHGGKSGMRQLGMIGFSSQALKTYDQLEMTALEILESIDMMRFIENDISIQGVLSSSPILGVDRPGDIQKAELMMANDSLVKDYQFKYL
jgi:3-deoxy-manno-octulosonate cytidylyltransferase (CMP-KDO synthetase)